MQVHDGFFAQHVRIVLSYVDCVVPCLVLIDLVFRIQSYPFHVFTVFVATIRLYAFCEQ